MMLVDKLQSATRSGVDKINTKVINPLTDFLKRVDYFIRTIDWRTGRNYSPQPENALHVQGHAVSVSILMIAISVFLIFGPSL